jgi:hypothetical protein
MNMEGTPHSLSLTHSTSPSHKQNFDVPSLQTIPPSISSHLSLSRPVAAIHKKRNGIPLHLISRIVLMMMMIDE